MAERYVGIDLGTTHSLIAVWEGDGPRVLLNGSGEALVPSVVALDRAGNLLVGEAARERQSYAPESALSRFKPEMGSDRVLELGSMRLGPVAASSLVLRELLAMAEAELGWRPTEAVVTVPAWFREPQRRATLDAAQLAGLSVTMLLNEPTAAALAYGLGLAEAEQTVAVLDLGGGTFDVTILELYDGVVDVRASTGDVHLGGEDVTDALLAWVIQAGGLKAPDAEAMAQLRRRVERLKRDLAVGASQVDLSLWGGAVLEVSPAQLSEVCGPLMARAVRCMREAMIAAALRPDQIDEVLLVGGSARLKAFQEAAAAVFAPEPKLAAGVDEVVALGAAIQAALRGKHQALSERAVTDVLTHSLGVGIQAEWNGRVYPDRFSPVLSRGTTLPARRSSLYSTVHAAQTDLRFGIYEGEARDVGQNVKIGELRISGLKPKEDPDDREVVDLAFTQDLSGLLRCEAVVVSTGERVAVTLDRGKREMSGEQRSAAEASLARLAVHPRELLPNRLLMEQASSLVPLLTGARRERIDGLLHAFEGSLDVGEPEAIAVSTELLRRAVREVRAQLGLGAE